MYSQHAESSLTIKSQKKLDTQKSHSGMGRGSEGHEELGSAVTMQGGSWMSEWNAKVLKAGNRNPGFLGNLILNPVMNLHVYSFRKMS